VIRSRAEERNYSVYETFSGMSFLSRLQSRGATQVGDVAAAPDPVREDMPLWVFLVALVWLVALVALFFIWILTPGFRDELPKLYGHNPGIPVEVPWFGAIGGLVASLGGIVHYSRGRWLKRFNYWHVVKPAIGAITGAVSCLLLVVILRAASGNGKITTDATTFDASAFVFGYAESSFRQLIKTVTDVFLKPGSTPGAGGGGVGGTGGGGAGGTAGGAGGAPAVAKPAPADTKPAPAVAKPAPADTKPAPAVAKPAPADTKPAPTVAKPAPADTKPAPADTKGAPPVTPTAAPPKGD
jgi:hypothetical protein